jgi:hypothetical protein
MLRAFFIALAREVDRQIRRAAAQKLTSDVRVGFSQSSNMKPLALGVSSIVVVVILAKRSNCNIWCRCGNSLFLCLLEGRLESCMQCAYGS